MAADVFEMGWRCGWWKYNTNYDWQWDEFESQILKQEMFKWIARREVRAFRTKRPSGIWQLDTKNIYPLGIYLVKVNKNTTTRCEICSKLTIKTSERPQWCRSGVFIVNFEHVIAGWVFSRWPYFWIICFLLQPFLLNINVCQLCVLIITDLGLIPTYTLSRFGSVYSESQATVLVESNARDLLSFNHAINQFTTIIFINIFIINISISFLRKVTSLIRVDASSSWFQLLKIYSAGLDLTDTVT